MVYRLDIAPEPKRRVRLGRRGGYKDRRTKAYEGAVSTLLRQQHRGSPLAGPVCVGLLFVDPVPPKRLKSGGWPADVRARLAGSTGHRTKHDLSNLVKAVEDAANGIVYEDDRQIGSCVAFRQWGEVGRVVMVVAECPTVNDQPRVAMEVLAALNKERGT